LTEKGSELSKKLIKRHKVLVNLFTILGVNQENIENEVKNMEYYFSDEIIERIERFLINYS